MTSTSGSDSSSTIVSSETINFSSVLASITVKNISVIPFIDELFKSLSME